MFYPLAVVFTFQLLFSYLCVTLLPIGVQSRGFTGEKMSNITRSSTADRGSQKFPTPQPSKHSLKNRRPVVHVKARGPIKLTRHPTNSKRVRLFGRVGLFLHCNANGTVSGSLNQNSKFGRYIDIIILLYSKPAFFFSRELGELYRAGTWKIMRLHESTKNLKCGVLHGFC